MEGELRRKSVWKALGLLTLLLLLVLPATAGRAQEAGAGEALQGPLSGRIDERSDAELAASLARRFQPIAELRSVQVQVDAGVVMLRGEVLTEAARQRAVNLARRTEGVAEVVDEIRLETDVRDRLAPTMDKAVELFQNLLAYLPLLLVSILIVALFTAAGRVLTRWEGLFRRLSPNVFVQQLARQVVRVATLLAGLLIALELLDATALVGAVLGTAGVIGLALGFAFRDLVENYIASILLSLRQPFEPNDLVEVDGRLGKVIRLTSRATILMTPDGNHLRIPNSQVFKGVLLNYTRNPRRRFGFGVGIGVGEDLVEAQKLGVEVLGAMEGVLDDPQPLALIEELGDSSVLVRFYGWVDQRHADFLKVQGEAIRQVKAALEGAGMDLPEPIYRVHLVGNLTGAQERPGPKMAVRPQAPAKQPAEPVGGIPPSTLSSRPSLDLAPADPVDEQIAAERRAAPQDDLLDPQAPKE